MKRSSRYSGFTFVFSFKIEKLTKKCLFLQWEETQGKRRKKTKTQTRLHQTQLVEQSLGHKKKEEHKFIFIPAGKRVASAWFPFL
jgi:hypothetical protein